MALRFYLNFLQIPSFGRIEVHEPFKSDGSTFTTEQVDDGYARDVEFGSEEISLEFPAKTLSILNPDGINTYMPDGTYTPFLTSGFAHLIECYKLWGQEMQVEVIISDNGVDFVVGMIDGKTAETDALTLFITKVVQQTKKAQIKRQEDTEIDVFGTTDLGGNPIDPIDTISMLLKARPELQTSKWTQSKTNITQEAGGSIYVNYTSVNPVYGINNSLVPFYQASNIDPNPLIFSVNNFKYIRAQEDLSNIHIHLDNDIDFVYRITGGGSGSFARISLLLYVYDEPFSVSDVDTYESYEVYDKLITGTSDVDFHLPDTIDFDLPFIERGRCLAIFWKFDWDESALGSDKTRWLFHSCDMIITATSTAVDTVVKCVRYIELFKYLAKWINGMEIEAPRYDVDGQFYNNVVLNGYLMRQFTNKPFLNKWKDLRESLQGVGNGDAQINDDKIFIGIYKDFYTNEDMGSFLSSPAREFNITTGERQSCNKIELGFGTFDSNAETDNGNNLNDVHTEFQLLNPQQKNSQDTFKRTFNFIRSAIKIEAARKQSLIVNADGSYSSDDSQFIIEIVPLPEGQMGHYTGKLLQRSTDVFGEIQVLNNDEAGNGIAFDWQLLGIGTTITITQGDNSGEYTVTLIETGVITLQGSSAITDADQQISLEWPMSDVLYTNRTNEGYISITGISSPNNCANLAWTPSQIRQDYYGEQMATLCRYYPLGILRMMYYRNDTHLITQREGEDVFEHNANVEISSLPEPILTDKIITETLSVGFAEAKQLYRDIQNKRGFIRIKKASGGVVKVYPYKMPYLWLKAQMISAQFEEKQDIEGIEILSFEGSDIIQINQSSYEPIQLSTEWFRMTGDFLEIFDSNEIEISELTHYTKVKVNGIYYDSAEDLFVALSLL